MKRLLPVVLLASCASNERPVDFPDVDLNPPATVELESRLDAYRAGREKYHADPKQVAHTALLNHLDVPWRGTPYRAEDYEFFERNREKPEWGSYVVRGFVEHGTGRHRRYRVKLQRYEEIWYATQISRYMLVKLSDAHDDEREGPPSIGK